MDNYVKGVKVIEIYDAANKELLVKYDDKHNIDKVISALNIKSWKETEKSIGMNPKYTIKFYCDTTNQDEEKDIKEITLARRFWLPSAILTNSRSPRMT